MQSTVQHPASPSVEPPELPKPNDSWSAQLLSSFTSVEELAQASLITSDEALTLGRLGERFRVRVPRYYAGLMNNSVEGRASCPIRKQALPALGEEDPVLPPWAQEWSRRAFGRREPWTNDAIGDVAKLAAPRLTHRYGNRAILHLSSLCALYCRFCFRKSHLNDSERTLYDGSLDPALAYLSEHTEIREVILTGGDPLSLPDAWLARFLDRLEKISHLKHVRLHSRMGATLPARLTPELAVLLSDRSYVVSLVSHFNHPKELTEFALERLAGLRRRGIPLYNQSVLLRGVNDDDEVLYTLFQALFENGVMPFYLHQADWTPGTFDFRLPIARGQALMTQLAGRLSGPALPHYVLDIPEGGGKISLTGRGVRLIDERSDGKIGGALFEVITPQTRNDANVPQLYAEFWKV